MNPFLSRAFLGAVAAAALTVPLAALPQAGPSATPSTGSAPLTVTFSPNSSSGSFYQWQFNYNPAAGFVPDYSSEVGEPVIHTYSTAGTYTARLRVYDAITGIPADTDFAITVLPPPAPPVVNVTFAPYPTLPDETVTFTATAVPSPGRSIVAYSWDFNGDGAVDATSGAGPSGTASSSFSPLGPHTITVTAMDNGGLAGKATAEVRIGTPPQISFNDPKSRMATPGFAINLSVTATAAAPWAIDRYLWDFGGGTGVVNGGGASATVSFASTGNYTVTVTAVDTAGHSKAAAMPVEVVVSGSKLVQHELQEHTATYTFMAFPPAGFSITSYGWDFTGDGVDDPEAGTGATATWWEEWGGNGPVTVKAYLNSGDPLTASLPLKYFIPSYQFDVPVPIALTVSSDGVPLSSPATIRVGHVVNFLASAWDGDPQIKEILWDFDGDGLREQSDNLLPLNTTAVFDIPASYQYRNPGTFTARARVLTTKGRSGTQEFTLVVSPGMEPLECFISQPHAGQRVWGNHLSLQAKTAPAILTRQVEFRYRPEGSGPWTVIGTAAPPPYTSLSVTWDVTKLTPGASYEILAVATDTSGNTAYSDALQKVVVTVDPDAPDEVENLGQVLVRTHTIDPNVATRSVLGGNTAIEFPPHAFGMEYTTIRLERPFSNPHPLEARLQQLQFVPGSFRRLALDGGAGLQQPSKIALYDINPGGILNELGVDPSKLRIYQFDDGKKLWVPLFGQVVQPGEDLARATLMSMGDVGLVMEPGPRAPSDAPSGGCGFLGPELLILALLVARRRPRC